MSGQEARTASGGEPLPFFGALESAVGETARRLWWVWLVTGIAWIAVSLIILRFDVRSAAGVGVLAGVVFLVAGLQDLTLAFVLKGGWRWFSAALGVILVAGGIVALANPLNTFLALAALVGWLLLFKGLFDVAVALADRSVDLWWLRLVLGLVEIALAFVVSGHFVREAIFLIAFVGASALAKGITDVVLAFQIRAVGKALR